MTVSTEKKKYYRCGLWLLASAIVIIAIVLMIKEWYSKMPNAKPQGELVKMIGVKGESPLKLSSYESITGVLSIQHWITENGVRVYFVPVSTLPMVDIELVFDAGSARNGKQGGLAYLTNQLLAEGAGELTADQVAQHFDEVGAQYHAESKRDMATIQLRSLSSPKELKAAVENLSAILATPSFPEVGFKREQQNTLIRLKKQAQMPQQVANKALFSAMYPDEPYSNWILGDENSVTALTRQDVKAFYEKYYVAKNAVVAIVGDVTAEEANALVEVLTEKLPKGEKAPSLPKVASLKAESLKKIDFPSVQTHILLGEPVLEQGDPDYYALYVGNHILGGNGSVTRIFNVVRNQHGLAYSAYSTLLPMHEKGPFVLGCQTRNDKAEEALKLIEDLLKEFVAKGPTEKELASAKQNLLGGYALQFDSNASICQQVAALGFYGLPLSYFNEFKPKVDKLSVEDIKAAFQKRIVPDKMAIVMVGGKAAPDGPLNLQSEPKKSLHESSPNPGAPQM